MLSTPDVLVLGAGGAPGEAWLMGVLAGIEDGAGLDLRSCEYFLGTSAGAIVAARLAAGKPPRRPASVDREPAPVSARPLSPLAATALAAARRAGGLAVTASATFAPLALGLATPAGAVVRAALLRSLPRPAGTLDRLRAEVESSGATFDGRLRVVAVQRSSGRRVVFGRPGAPDASAGEAVEASCTVPWLFAPVVIGGQEYVDGGVWSPTNLDAAPAGRGTQVLCLNPTANIIGDHALIGVVRGVSRSAASVEALALRRRGASVRIVVPDAACAAAIGSSVLDGEPTGRVLVLGYLQGLALAGRAEPA
jgi:NTE family protein